MPLISYSDLDRIGSARRYGNATNRSTKQIFEYIIVFLILCMAEIKTSDNTGKKALILGWWTSFHTFHPFILMLMDPDEKCCNIILSLYELKYIFADNLFLFSISLYTHTHTRTQPPSATNIGQMITGMRKKEKKFIRTRGSWKIRRKGRREGNQFSYLISYLNMILTKFLIDQSQRKEKKTYNGAWKHAAHILHFGANCSYTSDMQFTSILLFCLWFLIILVFRFIFRHFPYWGFRIPIRDTNGSNISSIIYQLNPIQTCNGIHFLPNNIFICGRRKTYWWTKTDTTKEFIVVR